MSSHAARFLLRLLTPRCPAAPSLLITGTASRDNNAAIAASPIHTLAAGHARVASARQVMPASAMPAPTPLKTTPGPTERAARRESAQLDPCTSTHALSRPARKRSIDHAR